MNITNRSEDRIFRVGDIVEHFKIEYSTAGSDSNMFTYKILAFAQHTERDEKLVIYQAMYYPYATFARPMAMFNSVVDKTKYPNIKRKYRMVKIHNGSSN